MTPPAPMILSVAFGGVLGTLARWGVSGALPQGESTIPRGTLAVNLIGSFVVGFAMRYGAESLAWSPTLRAGITIGFCGAFTTMSTFAWESTQLGASGQWLKVAAYLAITVVGCFFAVLAGSALAGRVV